MVEALTRADDVGLAAGLARLAALGRHAAGAEAALEAARRAFIDTCGVTLAGWGEPPVAMLDAVTPNGQGARALAGGREMDAADAARLNGMAGHVLDYDDVALHGHPSVVLVPAILAEAQRLGAGGRQALAAYVLGFEAWAELCSREADSYHLGSWHPTATLGVVAATVAVAALNGLDAHASESALGLAASFAGGVIGAFGSPAKPLQAARAAAGAVEAVRLAKAGLYGAPEALAGRHGLLAGISPQGRVDTHAPMRLPGGDGGWRLLEVGLTVKRYPVCYAAHRVIDAAIALRREAGLRPDDLAIVHATLARAPALTLRFDRPTTGLEARFSLQHAVAAALVDGAVGFEQLEDSYVRRPDVAALHPLIQAVIVEDQPSPDQPGLALEDRLVVETRDGRRLDSGPIRYARGHTRAPLGDAELAAKFLDCARRGGHSGGEALLEKLRGLDRLASLETLHT